jgi:thiol-disulfide isomerase/thioredoxin
MRSFLDRLLGPRASNGLPFEGRAPELTGLTGWVGAEAVTLESLRGRVVMLDFWTFSCINCLRTLPHLQAWHEAYRDRGFTVLGVHTPEFSFERDEAAVRRAVARHGLTYPVALDNEYAAWKAYGNRYWPAHYFIDAAGNVRAHHFGEGGYEDAERTLRTLLTESGRDLTGIEPVSRALVTKPAANAVGLTPETYLGWDRLEYLGSAETVRVGLPQEYSCPPDPSLGIFYLSGRWQIENEYAEAAAEGAGITYRCRAADVFMVLDGPAGAELEVRLGGQELSPANCGADAHLEEGRAVVRLDVGRLYHLVAAHEVTTITLELTFRTPGARAYSFTFG